MKLLPMDFRRALRSLELHLANQVEAREDKAIKSHIAAVSASIGKPSKRRAEPMPYRLRIAVAFASLASALASLYAWYP